LFDLTCSSALLRRDGLGFLGSVHKLHRAAGVAFGEGTRNWNKYIFNPECRVESWAVMQCSTFIYRQSDPLTIASILISNHYWYPYELTPGSADTCHLPPATCPLLMLALFRSPGPLPNTTPLPPSRCLGLSVGSLFSRLPSSSGS
jgi:hypothetical protein